MSFLAQCCADSLVRLKHPNKGGKKKKKKTGYGQQNIMVMLKITVLIITNIAGNALRSAQKHLVLMPQTQLEMV